MFSLEVFNIEEEGFEAWIRPNVAVYLLRYDLESKTEFEKFIEGHVSKRERRMVAEILDGLSAIIETDEAFYRSNFRHEAEGLIYALPEPSRRGIPMRLYAIIWPAINRHTQTIILCGGAIKTARTWQEDLAVGPIVEKLRTKVIPLLRSKIGFRTEYAHDDECGRLIRNETMEELNLLSF